MKVRFPFPTSRNNQLREGSGWDRIEDSIQQMAEVINNGDDAIYQAVEAAEAAQDAAEAAQDAAETASSQAMSGTPEGYSDVLASIAEEFSAETAYSAGTIVWRNSKLYLFTSDHAVGSWTGTDAEEIAISTELTDIKNDFNVVTTITVSPNLYNSEDDDILTNKYINPNGTVETISGRTVTGFIPVTPGNKVTFQANGWWYTFSSTCFYAANKTTVISGGVYNKSIVTVPENATYIRVTFSSDLNNVQIECNNGGTISPYIAYGKMDAKINNDVYIPNLKKWKKPFEKKTGNLSDGQFIKMTARTDVRKNNRVVFNCAVTSFTSVTIAKSANVNINNISNPRNMFVIDDTNITYKWDGSTQTAQEAHGLTISDNMQVILEESDINTCKVTLISDGNSYTHTFDYRIYENGAFFVLSTESVLTDCEFVWMCSDIDKLAWIFGDSYCQYSEDRWAYYLHTYGYDKSALINAYAGEGSSSAYPSFNNLLTYGTPKFALWFIGLNDGSDSAEAPSTNWATGRDRFLGYCLKEHITPVFGTIPTVPNINSEQKNTWIRNSGYRYVDFAKAVGASSSGVWYDGMLASDNIHPTAKGAKALFAQFLSDFPEIMLD